MYCWVRSWCYIKGHNEISYFNVGNKEMGMRKVIENIKILGGMLTCYDDPAIVGISL